MSDKMIRLPRGLRDQLHEYKRKNDLSSLSEAVDALVPVEGRRLEIPEEDMVVMTIDDSVHERVHRLTGDNISAYETIAHYGFKESKADISEARKEA